jgi:large repetitive protein
VTAITAAVAPAAVALAACGDNLAPARTADAAGTVDAVADAPAAADAPVFAITCGDVGGLAPGAAWPEHGRCPTNTRRADVRGPRAPALRWERPTSGGEAGYAIGADGAIYYDGEDFQFCAVEPTGATRWCVDTAFTASTVPALGTNGDAYASTLAGRLTAVGADGVERWRFEDVEDVFSAAPVIAGDGSIYQATGLGWLYRFSPDGAVRARVELGGASGSTPAIANDVIYVHTTPGELIAIGLDDNAIRWRATTPAALTGGQAVAVGPDGTIYTVGVGVTAVSPAGEVRWHVSFSTTIPGSAAIGADGTVYVGAQFGPFVALDPAGTPRWSRDLHMAPGASPVIDADGIIYVPTDDAIVALDADGATRWTLPLPHGGIRGGLSLGADGALVVGAANAVSGGSVYVLADHESVSR